MVYTGRVTDKNGIAIAGVAVSDGINTVFTDSAGMYRLEGFERSYVLNVGVLTNSHDDWYVYTDCKDGVYDFCIDPVTDAKEFCFLHTSDTEIENTPKVEWIDFAKDTVKEHSPAFFIHTGDLCRQNGVTRHYKVFNFDTVGCPVRYAIGNHDFIGERYGEEIYEKLYGPTRYSFDVGDVHFIVLSIGKGDNPTGYIPSDQITWLKNDIALTNKKRIIVFDHDCCEKENDFCIKTDTESVDLRAHGIEAWVYGHYHFNHVHNYDGVLSICTALPDSGGIDSSEAGIRKISVGKDIKSEIIYFQPLVEAPDKSVFCSSLPGVIHHCDVVLADGDIITATGSDGYPHSNGIYRIDGQSGDIKWKYDVTASVKNNVTVSDGKVYAEDSMGYLYCVDFQSGQCIFKVQSDIPVAPNQRNGILIANGFVIGGAPKRLHAYDKDTGKLCWVADTVKSEGSPARMIFDSKNSRIIVSSHWKDIRSIDINTGKTVWQSILDKNIFGFWFRSATPIIIDDAIYTVSHDKFMKVNLADGSLIKYTDARCMTDVAGAPAYDKAKRVLYFPTADIGVVAVDIDTLEVIRRYPAGNAALFTSPYLYGNIQTVETSPIIKEDMLIFAASDGGVYFYSKDTAKLIRKINIGAPTLSTPIITDSYIITADFNGNIKKYEL